MEQYREIAEEVQQLKSIQESKNSQIQQMQTLFDEQKVQIETKEDKIKMQKREISILQSETARLTSEVKVYSDLVKEHKTNHLVNSLTRKRSVQSSSRDLMLKDNEIDIEDLKRAANDLLKESIFRTANTKDKKPAAEEGSKSHRKFNPIQTPMESEKTPKINHKMRQSILGSSVPQTAQAKCSNKDQGCLQMMNT